MFRVIDGSDSGKTKKLLRECSANSGVFMCAHPKRVNDKCKAYGIDPDNITAIGYEDYRDIIDGIYGHVPVYIDEVESFLRYIIPSVEGYSNTIDILEALSKDSDVLKGFRVKFISLFINYCRIFQIVSLVLLCYLAWVKSTYIGEFLFLLTVFINALSNRLIGYKHGLEEKDNE